MHKVATERATRVNMARRSRNSDLPTKPSRFGQASPASWRTFFVGSFAALAVAPHLLPCEAHAQGGVAISIIMLWLVLLCAWFAHQIGLSDAKIHFGWADGLLMMLALLNVASAVRAIHSGQAVARPAINMASQWIGLGAMFFLARQLLHDPRVNRAICTVMLALGLALSVHGISQVFYSFPNAIRAFQSDPDAALRSAGFAAPEGSPQRSLFASRLSSRQPTSTYALTNSLAGYLATWSVMLAWLCLAPTSPKSNTWGRIACPVLLGLPMIVCLVLTRSRTGQMAFVVGLVVLLILRRHRRVALGNSETERSTSTGRSPNPADSAQPKTRSAERQASAIGPAGLAARPYVWVIGSVIVAMIALIGLLQLFPESGAAKSLLYRSEYWQATGSMIWDHPVRGCGPGQFQDVYAAYKFPQSSEMIADPHNLLLEIWATAGTPAMICLVGFMFAVLGAAMVKALTDEEPSSAAPTTATGHVWVGGAIGVAIGYVVSWLVGYPLDSFFLVAGIPLAALVWALTDNWVKFGSLPATVSVICFATLGLNLLAAGGINYLSVATTLLLVGVFAINSTERQPTRSSTSAHRGKAFTGLAVALVLILLVYRWSYGPIIQGQSHIQRGRFLLQEASQRSGQGVSTGVGSLLDQAAAQFEAAAEHDPHDPAALMQLARTQLEQRIRHRDSLSGRRFADTVERALTQQPQRYVAWQQAATWYGQAFRRWEDEAYLSNAIRCWKRGVSRYPNSAMLQAELAWWLRLARNEEEAKIHACRALELNDLNPHSEYKLEQMRLSDPGLLTGPDTLAEDETGQLPGPADETAFTWMTRLCDAVQ